MLKSLHGFCVGKQEDIPDLSLPWNERIVIVFCQIVHHLLMRAGLFRQIVFVRFPKSGHKHGAQTGFFLDFPGCGLHFRFAAFHMTLGKAVCSGSFLHEDEQDFTVTSGEYHSAAGFFLDQGKLLSMRQRKGGRNSRRQVALLPETPLQQPRKGLAVPGFVTLGLANPFRVDTQKVYQSKSGLSLCLHKEDTHSIGH